jgi:hypothetical protein
MLAWLCVTAEVAAEEDHQKERMVDRLNWKEAWFVHVPN